MSENGDDSERLNSAKIRIKLLDEKLLRINLCILIFIGSVCILVQSLGVLLNVEDEEENLASTFAAGIWTGIAGVLAALTGFWTCKKTSYLTLMITIIVSGSCLLVTCGGLTLAIISYTSMCGDDGPDFSDSEANCYSPLIIELVVTIFIALQIPCLVVNLIVAVRGACFGAVSSCK